PTVPLINAPADGAWLNVALPTISWSASTDLGSGVASYSLAIDNGTTRTFAADQTMVTLSAALGEGRHCLAMHATDAVGNASADVHRCFGIDLTPPSPPAPAAPANGSC